MPKNAAHYGARILDRVMPRLGRHTWWNEVNTGILDLSSMDLCVLGQLFRRNESDSFGFDYAKNYHSRRYGTQHLPVVGGTGPYRVLSFYAGRNRVVRIAFRVDS